MFFFTQSPILTVPMHSSTGQHLRKFNMPHNPIDYQTRTECSDSTAIYTDEWDNGISLAVMVRGGSARATLTREQAHALIDAIQFALSANEATT
jgi:hypothetical protein